MGTAIKPFTDKCGCTNSPAFRRCQLHSAAPAMWKMLKEELNGIMGEANRRKIGVWLKEIDGR